MQIKIMLWYQNTPIWIAKTKYIDNTKSDKQLE